MTPMTIRKTWLMLTALPAVGLLTLSIGCAKSSHRSVSTYEYSQEPPRAEQTQPARDEETIGEYKMVSPGEMIVE